MLHLLASSWPLSIGFFGFFALIVLGLIFRGDVSGAMARLKSFGRDGAQLAYPEQAERAPPEAGTGQAEELLRELDNALVRQAEEQVAEALRQRHVADPGERERILTRYLAVFAILWDFERRYNDIWGSQLRALNAANTGVDGAPVPLDQLRTIFSTAQQVWGGVIADDTFERWMGYLVAAELLEMTDTTAKTTMKGREFLKYLIDQGRRPEYKPN